jgi:hypothetical protein
VKYAYDITLGGMEDTTSGHNGYVTDLVVVYPLDMDRTVGGRRDYTHVCACQATISAAINEGLPKCVLVL